LGEITRVPKKGYQDNSVPGVSCSKADKKKQNKTDTPHLSAISYEHKEVAAREDNTRKKDQKEKRPYRCSGTSFRTVWGTGGSPKGGKDREALTD